MSGFAPSIGTFHLPESFIKNLACLLLFRFVFYRCYDCGQDGKEHRDCEFSNKPFY